ncbi:MAG: Nramp family divalent metal transporter [Halobacteriales archaeon]
MTDAGSGRSPSSPDADVYADPEDADRYAASTYVPVAYGNLQLAPVDETAPDPGTGGRFRLLDLPTVPKLRHLVGPSAIMLGASLGSGETLFWPGLIARHGWALYWAFWVGVLTQFVINTEIQRWTLATGESIFRGFDRVHRAWPLFLLAFGFLSLGWPGWAASAAQVGASGLGLGSLDVAAFGGEFAGWRAFGIVLMVLIWLTYQLTPLMYNVVERIQLMLVSVTTVLALVLFVVARPLGELGGVPAGAVSFGTLPPTGEIAAFLGGMAFAGAGGYLNLSQSLWVREKGYAMGRYQGRVKNPLIGDEPEPVERDGFAIRPTRTNFRRWRAWWLVARLEHFLTFVVGLLVVSTLLMAVAAAYAGGSDAGALTMWLGVVVPALGRFGGTLVYLVLFVALFTTEYAIVESFVRNSADVVYETYGRDAGWRLPRIFWTLLTVFSLWGILVLSLPIPIEEPFGLLVLNAALSGLMMWPYSVLTVLINTARLPEHVQPSWFRIVAMWWASGIFGYLSVLLLGLTLQTDFGLAAFRTEMTVVGSAPGGYLLWAVFFGVQAYAVVRTVRAKRRAQGTVEDAEEARGRIP